MCLRLAQNFQDAGHDVQILGRFSHKRHRLEEFFSASEKPKDFECQGVKVKILSLDGKAKMLLRPLFRMIWRKWTFPVAKWLYVEAMREQIAKACSGADVVHFFGNGPEMLGFAAEAAARQVRAKFVIEPALHEGQWGDKWFDALLYKRADLLLAHTRHEAAVLERMGIPSAKVRTIVHGVDFCDSGDGDRFRKKHGINGPMVLFLGRKTKEKGVERLLKAWPMVAEKFPEATLVFAGPKNAEFDKLKNSLTRNHTNRHEKGNGDLTTDYTDGHGWGGAGPSLDEPSGAAFSNPSTSELARDSENTSRNRSVIGPASALRAIDRGMGSAGSGQLTDSKGGLGEQSQAGLQMDSQKPPNIRKANAPDTSGQSSSSVLISDISGRKTSGTLDSGRWALDSAPRARVLNLDDLTEGEKQDALAACDLLCMPSEGESFGMVYFEAWAYKKPVVALDLPTLRETIEANEAGLLTRDDTDELAAAVGKLIGDRKLAAEMGLHGRTLLSSHSWDSSTASYMAAYSSTT